MISCGCTGTTRADCRVLRLLPEAVRGGAPFEIADLQAIFKTPVFTVGERPKGGKGEAAFWLPLLALFTGARLGELASLRASDVARDDAIGAVRANVVGGRTRRRNRHV